MIEKYTITDPYEDWPLEVIETVKFVRAYCEEQDAFVEMTFNSNDKLHSFNDEPAYKTIDKETGITSVLAWFDDGLEHRTGNPSLIGYFRNGNEAHRRWCQRGDLHRDYLEGPASESFCAITGNHDHISFCQNGVHYHPYQAAELEIEPKSKIVFKELWYTLPDTGLEHREGGPSFTIRDARSGKTVLEMHKQNGELFRPNNKPPILALNPETGLLEGKFYKEADALFRLSFSP